MGKLDQLRARVRAARPALDAAYAEMANDHEYQAESLAYAEALAPVSDESLALAEAELEAEARQEHGRASAD